VRGRRRSGLSPFEDRVQLFGVELAAQLFVLLFVGNLLDDPVLLGLLQRSHSLAPEQVARSVGRDLEQPRGDLAAGVVDATRPEGLDEGVLAGLLGVLARAQDLVAEAEDRDLVALDEAFEGTQRALGGKAHQLLVARATEPRLAAGAQEGLEGLGVLAFPACILVGSVAHVVREACLL
jgi:hypothetical protein